MRGSNICLIGWLEEDMGENLNLMYPFIAQTSVASLTLGAVGRFQSSCHGLQDQIRRDF